MLGCQDAYYRKSAAVPLLTQHNYHYRLTLQLYTTGYKMLLLNMQHATLSFLNSLQGISLSFIDAKMQSCKSTNSK